MSVETIQPIEPCYEITRSDVLLASAVLRDEGEDAIRNALIYCDDHYEDEEYGPEWANLCRLAILGANTILHFDRIRIAE